MVRISEAHSELLGKIDDVIGMPIKQFNHEMNLLFIQFLNKELDIKLTVLGQYVENGHWQFTCEYILKHMVVLNGKLEDCFHNDTVALDYLHHNGDKLSDYFIVEYKGVTLFDY